MGKGKIGKKDLDALRNFAGRLSQERRVSPPVGSENGAQHQPPETITGDKKKKTSGIPGDKAGGDKIGGGTEAGGRSAAA